MKLFISQPMVDKTDEFIKEERKNAIEYAKKTLGEDIEIVDSFFEGAPHDAKPLWFLGKSFQLLSTADVTLFIGEWKKYRGKIMRKYGARATKIAKQAQKEYIKNARKEPSEPVKK